MLQWGAGRAAAPYHEVLAPVTDPLILRCLACFEEAEQEAAHSGRRGSRGAQALLRWVSALVQGRALDFESGQRPSGGNHRVGYIREAQHSLAAT